VRHSVEGTNRPYQSSVRMLTALFAPVSVEDSVHPDAPLVRDPHRVEYEVHVLHIAPAALSAAGP
jgi:hypothetical protein